jgi:precorrin-6B methylase 2
LRNDSTDTPARSKTYSERRDHESTNGRLVGLGGNNEEGPVEEVTNAEGKLYTYAAELFTAHEKMLVDLNRNRAFYDALKKHVTADSVVLDIGSGTGIWAIAAAKLGARRVVAVERDPLLIGLIRSLAKENGVSDRVEAVAAYSTQVQLPREFDIVISEMIGHLAYEEQLIPILTDARDRFLKPGGALIPQSVALYAAAAHLKTRRLPAGVPIKYERFESLNINIPVGLSDRSRLKLITEPRELARADLMTIKADLDLSRMTARWNLEDASNINCFAVWVESTFTEGVTHTTMLASHWKPLIYRVRPFAGKSGELEFNLALTPVSNYWTATLSDGEDREAQSYSPVYVGNFLLAQSRTDADLLDGPHRMTFTGMGSGAKQ